MTSMTARPVASARAVVTLYSLAFGLADKAQDAELDQMMTMLEKTSAPMCFEPPAPEPKAKRTVRGSAR